MGARQSELQLFPFPKTFSLKSTFESSVISSLAAFLRNDAKFEWGSLVFLPERFKSFLAGQCPNLIRALALRENFFAQCGDQVYFLLANFVRLGIESRALF